MTIDPIEQHGQNIVFTAILELLLFIGTENVHKYPNVQNKYRKSLDPCVPSQYDSQSVSKH